MRHIVILFLGIVVHILGMWCTYPVGRLGGHAVGQGRALLLPPDLQG